MYELTNDVLSLENLVLKLDPKNAIVKKISEMLHKIKAKCKETVESKIKTNLDVTLELSKTVGRFENLKASYMISHKPIILMNKIKFDDFISNICRNAIEAGADQLRIEIRDSSLMIYDNGKCSREIVDKLREGVVFSTKPGGRGIGTQSIRSFCIDNNFIINYYLSPSIDFKFKKESLAIKLIFK